MDTSPHPVTILRRLGVRDIDVGIAIGSLLLCQVVLILAMFRNYSNATEAGFSLDSPLRWIFIIFPLMIALILAAGAVLRWRKQDSTNRHLEKLAEDQSFDDLQRELATLKAKADIVKPVMLYYHLAGSGPYSVHYAKQNRVVIGPNLRAQFRSSPAFVRSLLAHELSHLELGATQDEQLIRRSLWVYAILVSGLLLSLILFVLFLAPMTHAGRLIAATIAFVPKGHLNPFEEFGGHLILGMINLIAVIVFGFFFVARREFAHDFRASQLADSQSLLWDFFAPRCLGFCSSPWGRRAFISLRDFIGLHPSECERARSLENRDFLNINTNLYPAICGLLFPAMLLLTAPIHDVLQLSLAASNLTSIIVLTILTFSVFRADTIRFALAWMLKRPLVKLGFRYCLALTMYSILTGAILAVWYLHRHSNSLRWLLLQWRDSCVGGCRLFVFYSGLLFVLGYVSAVRISAFGDSSHRLVAAGEWLAGIIITLLAEILLSMRTLTYVSWISVILVGVILIFVVGMLICSRCRSCRRTRVGCLLGQSKCAHCGHEHIPYLRVIAVA